MRKIIPKVLLPAPLREPSFIQKSKNFANAAMQHREAGYPRASDEQVATRFAICEMCIGKGGFFQPTGEGQGRCTHTKCGCGLRSVGNESVFTPNKLRWAEQICPIGKWGSVIPVKKEKSIWKMKVRTLLFGGSPVYERCTKVLEYTANKFSPGNDFQIIRVGKLDKAITSLMGKGRNSHDTNNALKTKYQMELVRDAEDGELLCLLDADTMITGDLLPVWDYDFDLAVTDKEGKQEKAPINTGVLFVRVSDKTREWFQCWFDTVIFLLNNVQELRKEKKKYMGINQSALAILMRKDHDLNIKLLPCRIWNSTTITWSDFNEETKIVHILGGLRRAIFNRQFSRGKNIGKLVSLWNQLEREMKGENANKV